MERNYKLVYALIKELGNVDKRLAVYNCTSGRTTSMREMTDAEFLCLVEWLKKLEARAKHEEARAIALKAARSRALHQLQLYGVDTTDWEAVNRYVSQPRIMGKVFVSLSLEELEALTKKMRAINAKPRRQRSASSQEAAEVPVHKPSYIVVPRSPRGEG